MIDSAVAAFILEVISSPSVDPLPKLSSSHFNFIQVVARHGEPADVICAKEPFLMTQATFSISCLGWSFNNQAGQKGHPDLLVSCLTCSFSPRLVSLQLPLTILRYTNTCRLIHPIQKCTTTLHCTTLVQCSVVLLVGTQVQLQRGRGVLPSPKFTYQKKLGRPNWGEWKGQGGSDLRIKSIIVFVF